VSFFPKRHHYFFFSVLLLCSQNLNRLVWAEKPEHKILDNPKNETTITSPSVQIDTEPITLEREDKDVSSSPASLPPGIITTRPSFTDSWLAIPQGSFQAESGTTYSDFSNRTRSVLLPETLVKLGIGKNTELRYSVPNYTYIHSKDTGTIGNHFGDTTVGFSHHIGLPQYKLDIALIPFLNLPTGANRVSTNALDPQFRAVIARTINPKWVVASQLDTRWNTGQNRQTDVLFNPTLITYYSFTPKHCGFFEYAGLIPTQGKNQQFLQAGYLYIPTPRQQWDIRIAKGLNRESPDIVVGFGYSFRVDGLFGDSRKFSSFNRTLSSSKSTP
jgi:hypothetical protein